MLVNVFNFAYPGEINFNNFEIYFIFIQQIVLYLTLVLLVLFVLNIVLVKYGKNSDKFFTLFNFIKISNIVVFTTILIFVILKFILFLWNFKYYSFYTAYPAWFSCKMTYVSVIPSFDLNCSAFSDVIILLAFSSGLVCIHLLGEKNLSKKIDNISIFSFFLIATIIMVYTSNILIMFVGFECLFLPTLYFVYHHGYVERVDKTLKILLYWTLSGAFLIFCSISYLYLKYKTLNIYSLTRCTFTSLEIHLLYLFIFLGFGVKIPVFPFHYWLTKIHVEAPAGFSIFLSGFLVKAAIYCFYYFNLLFNVEYLTFLTSTIALIGVVEASIKMWTQTDFKKLIAFATIQEMNLILFLLLNYQNILDYSLLLFILIHGWLSTLMFFLVDIIQKKTSTRNIVTLSGLGYNFSEIKIISWFIILTFSGFPLTVKFLIEWQIFGNFLAQNGVVYMFCLMTMVAVGVAGFAKQMIIILYGFPRAMGSKNYSLSKRDRQIFYFIIMLLVFLNCINYFLG